MKALTLFKPIHLKVLKSVYIQHTNESTMEKVIMLVTPNMKNSIIHGLNKKLLTR